MKKRALENVYDLFSDLESEEEEDTLTHTRTSSEDPSKGANYTDYRTDQRCSISS